MKTDRLSMGRQPDWSGIGRMVLERARLAMSAHLVEQAARSVDAVPQPDVEPSLDEAR